MITTKLHDEFYKKGFLLPLGLLIQKYVNPDIASNQQDSWVIMNGESIYVVKSTPSLIAVYYREISFIIYFAQLLEAMDQQEIALEILRIEANSLNNHLLFYHYANLLIRQKSIGEAKTIYQKHLCQQFNCKQFHIEYALLLKYFNKIFEMKEVCEIIIRQGIPKDKIDAYYHGFAYFLIGRTEESRAYYRDSESYGKYYSLVTTIGNQD